jgi:outer membrane protein assembly factor BamB
MSSHPRRAKLLLLALVSLGCRATVAGAAPPVVHAGEAADAAEGPTPPRARVPAPAQAPSIQGPVDDADRIRGIVWRFHAGAPLDGGPAVGPRGDVYVGTVEGYLHALRPDGAFRWSYTVKGGIVGAPLVSSDGVVHVATTTRQIYAIRPNGRRWWTFRSPVPIVTPIAMARAGSMVFGGGDDHIWAVSSRAGARWRAKLEGRIAAGPVVSPKGFPAVAVTADGVVSAVNGAWSRWDTGLGAAPTAEPVVLRDGSVVAVVGRRAVGLDAEGRRSWERPGVDRVATSPDGVLVFEDTVMVRLDRAGLERGRVELSGRASAVPLTVDGREYVPCEDGVLRVVDGDEVVGSLRIAAAPLHAPKAGRGGVVVAAGDGTVVMGDVGRMAGAS